MERLWAPWRLAYIKSKKDKGCPFCRLAKERPSMKNLVLWKDDTIFVVMNKFPYNPSHLLVIPRAHMGEPEALSPEVWSHLSRAVRACVEVLREQHGPQGFNLGMNLGHVGGAGIPSHLHWHVLPRWSGDTNFLPLLAEAKSVPIHNETVYRQLKPLFAGFEKRLAPVKIRDK